MNVTRRVSLFSTIIVTILIVSTLVVGYGIYRGDHLGAILTRIGSTILVGAGTTVIITTTIAAVLITVMLAFSVAFWKR